MFFLPFYYVQRPIVSTIMSHHHHSTRKNGLRVWYIERNVITFRSDILIYQSEYDNPFLIRSIKLSVFYVCFCVNRLNVCYLHQEGIPTGTSLT